MSASVGKFVPSQNQSHIRPSAIMGTPNLACFWVAFNMPSEALVPNGDGNGKPKKPRWPLPPWGAGFGYWEANQSWTPRGKGRRGPSKEEQCTVATKLANRGRDPALGPVVITYDQIRQLRKREDYKEFLATTIVGGFDAGKALLVNNIPAYVQAHFDALMWAHEKKDINGIATLASPVLKSVLPQENVVQKAVFNITFSDTRERLLTSERPVIEAEIIPPEAFEES